MNKSNKMKRNGLMRALEEQANVLSRIVDAPRLYAKDAMIKPLSFSADDQITKVLDKLKREDIDVCIVVDSDKRFVGEIADIDLVRVLAYTALNEPITRLLDRAYKKNLVGMTAGDLARPHKNIVQEKTPINEVLKRIYKYNDQSIVVENREGLVAGIITLSSLLHLLSKH